jgi:hypothetical protein
MVHFRKKSVLVAVAVLAGAILHSPSLFFLATQHHSSSADASPICGNPCPTLTRVVVYKRYEPSPYVSRNYPSIGLNISIPSDWNLSKTSQSINEISTHLSPIQSESDRFQENIVIQEGKYFNNLTLSEFSSTIVDGLQRLEDFQLIENLVDYTISGNPASKIVYSYSWNRIPYTTMVVGLVLGSSYLTFTYNAELGRYAEYLPTIEKILSSIKIDPTILAQKTQNSTLVSFEDEINGISLEYPTNWMKGSNNYLSSILTIFAPLDNRTDFYYDNIRINVDFSNETQANVTAKDQIIEFEKSFNSTIFNFKTLEKQELTVSDNPSYSITYSFTGDDGAEHKLQRIASIKDNKVYTMTYDSVSDTFDKYLPVLNQLLSSMQIS